MLIESGSEINVGASGEGTLDLPLPGLKELEVRARGEVDLSRRAEVLGTRNDFFSLYSGGPPARFYPVEVQSARDDTARGIQAQEYRQDPISPQHPHYAVVKKAIAYERARLKKGLSKG